MQNLNWVQQQLYEWVLAAHKQWAISNQVPTKSIGWSDVFLRQKGEDTLWKTNFLLFLLDVVKAKKTQSAPKS